MNANKLNTVILVVILLVGASSSLMKSASTAPAEGASHNGEAIARLRKAIAQQESGGDPGKINPHSDAVGSLQVMPANIPSWTQQCLGKSLSAEEFHQDPEAQAKVGNCKLQEYWAIASQQTSDEQTIVRKVAAAWYSGNMKLYDNPRPQPYTDPKTGKTHLYPSIKEYTISVWKHYERT